MLTNIIGLISYPGDIAMTFGVLAALTLATATLPLRTGTGQHADAGPGAVDVWRLRDTIRNAPHRHEPRRDQPHRYEPRLYVASEPDDDIVWPEEDWPDTPQIAHQAEPTADYPGSSRRPELRIPSPLRTAGTHEEDQHTGRHRLVEPDLYGLPAEIDLRLTPISCAAA
ncbi:hypothetical protein [Parasphingorhabdus pacifica]